MDWFYRLQEERLETELKKGKVTVLYGARRTGKTSLIEHFLAKKTDCVCFTGTGDDIELRNLLGSENRTLINTAFKNYDIVFIDEAQRIPNIGWGLKILIDANPHMRVIASGSSSFELSNSLGEPLTGRQQVYSLFPVSMEELEHTFGRMHILQNLQNYLIYGTYPETLLAPNNEEKQKYLLSLRNSYLFKDILELEQIKNSAKLADLLKLIAFQIGREVSLNELANSLGIAKQTVERYLDLLEKTFVILKVRPYAKNLRKEISKSARYYFWDNGIRNSLIRNFNAAATRDDMGMLWENFCFIERLKKQRYRQVLCNSYFWRTYDRQEIDLIEEREQTLYTYEFKWNPRKAARVPKAFALAYPQSHFECITSANVLDFVL